MLGAKKAGLAARFSLCERESIIINYTSTIIFQNHPDLFLCEGLYFLNRHFLQFLEVGINILGCAIMVFCNKSGEPLTQLSHQAEKRTKKIPRQSSCEGFVFSEMYFWGSTQRPNPCQDHRHRHHFEQ